MPRLRALAQGDLDMVLRWRNRPEVRRHMFTTHEISFDEHRSWFTRIGGDPTKCYLVYLDAEVPLGIVGFTDIDRENRTAAWGFYTGDAAPPGTGTGMLRAALDYAFDTMKVETLWSEVLATNTASLALHNKLGFQNQVVLRSHATGAGPIDVIRLEILRANTIGPRGPT